MCVCLRCAFCAVVGVWVLLFSRAQPLTEQHIAEQARHRNTQGTQRAHRARRDLGAHTPTAQNTHNPHAKEHTRRERQQQVNGEGVSVVVSVVVVTFFFDAFPADFFFGASGTS